MRNRTALAAFAAVVAATLACQSAGAGTCVDPAPLCEDHSVEVGAAPSERACIYTITLAVCENVSPLFTSSAGASFQAPDGTQAYASGRTGTPSSPGLDVGAGVSRLGACAEFVCAWQDTYSASHKHACATATPDGQALAACHNWVSDDYSQTEGHLTTVYGVEGHSPAFAVVAVRHKPSDPAVLIGAGVYHGRPNCFAAVVLVEDGEAGYDADTACL